MENKVFNAKSLNNPALKNGNLGIQTGHFKAADFKNLQVAVCMDDTPVFIMKGLPSDDILHNHQS